jgi:NADPH:quinone reductase-like Zn-dependent oxidoreductase
MTAMVFTEYDFPDRLQIKEVAKPTPKKDKVLVKVRASSINS